MVKIESGITVFIIWDNQGIVPDVLEKRAREDFGQQLDQLGWYHSLELPGRVIHGFLKLEELRERFASYGLPDDLTGKRVLDIGTWDGWFAFECERRGAEVVAVDLVEQPNFRYAHRALNSNVKYVLADVYEIPRLGLGVFDYTLFLGVLYHLRHPLLALDIVCALTKEIAIVDSFVLEGEDRRHIETPLPWMEFYETDELGRNVDNWFGPTLDCLQAMCRSAGFARVEFKELRHRHATLACHRKWEAAPENPPAVSPVLAAALHSGNYGINFEPHRLDEFLTCWFETRQTGITRSDLRPEIAGYGVPALTLRKDAQGNTHFSCRLPPGIGSGWHDVRLRTTDSGFSNVRKIAVGIPVQGAPVIRALCDGMNWREDYVIQDVSGAGHLVLWVEGLGENCDRNNVRVYLEDLRLRVEYVSDAQTGIRQVNAFVPTSVKPGHFPVTVGYGSNVSPSKMVRLETSTRAEV